jgi:hypothetical protein
MTQRSKDHHEVPKWLLKNFCIGETERLWVGFKATRKAECSARRKLFFRHDGNTRTDYIADGGGEFKRVRSDRDEGILSKLDSRASETANQLLQWARQIRETRKYLGPLPPDVVDYCKALVVAQARRARESQDRIGLTQGLEDRLWDSYYERAEELEFELGPREDLTAHPRVRVLFSDLEQNLRANFASGDDPTLKAKEDKFLLETGLQVAVIASSGPRFVIGNQGITILKGPAGAVSWLPLAPDVAISLTAQPNSHGLGIFSASFVEQHNKCALGMSKMIAGNSKQAIDDLLGTLDR